jgi:hypothetical protein
VDARRRYVNDEIEEADVDVPFDALERVVDELARERAALRLEWMREGWDV